MANRIIDVCSDNAIFQQLMAVKMNRNKRYRQGHFLIEGVRPANLAVGSGWPLVGAICQQGRELSGWARETLQHVPVLYRLSPGLMQRLSDREDSSELILMGKIVKRSLSDLPFQNKLLLLLDRPASPGNLGSILRSADAFCADGVIVSGHSADLFDPQTIRASVGTVFTLPAVTTEGPDTLPEIRRLFPGIQLVGTSAKADIAIDRFDLSRPILLLMGNETAGLSWRYKQSCDSLVGVPISGHASSLNLASAASILLYEVQRQKRGTACGSTSSPHTESVP